MTGTLGQSRGLLGHWGPGCGLWSPEPGGPLEILKVLISVQGGGGILLQEEFQGGPSDLREACELCAGDSGMKGGARPWLTQSCSPLLTGTPKSC